MQKEKIIKQFALKAKSYLPDDKAGKLKASRGFALIELLIAVVLFGVITSFVLVAYSKVSEQLFMTSLAYETALSFRQAQSYGVSVKQFGTTFDSAYGIHLSAIVDKRFVFFADADQDGIYKTGGDSETGCITGTGSECVSVYQVERNNKVDKFCGVPAGIEPEECSKDSVTLISFLDVSFLRPNPDAVIRTDQSTTYKAARVYLKSPSGIERIVEVWNTGQISIK